MEDFGYPPIFRETDDVDEPKVTDREADPVIKDKAKGKKVTWLLLLLLSNNVFLQLLQDVEG